jgi:hypothetical protein
MRKRALHADEAFLAPEDEKRETALSEFKTFYLQRSPYISVLLPEHARSPHAPSTMKGRARRAVPTLPRLTAILHN